jgi:hypothetical protein
MSAHKKLTKRRFKFFAFSFSVSLFSKREKCFASFSKRRMSFLFLKEN